MILNGWKEIASYVGRGVRTVQRWERFRLPVHRPATQTRSAVVAISEEIDYWLRNSGADALLSEEIEDALEARVHQLEAENAALRIKLFQLSPQAVPSTTSSAKESAGGFRPATTVAAKAMAS